MRSSKSRSRSKSNRNRSNSSGGNVINRVFDSSGPEGKVRGTPQQIIEKYNQLARDAQLGNDRVATENFQQHAEHYLRLLNEAQREVDQRREEHDRQNRERQAERDRERAERQERESNSQPDPQPQPAEQSMQDERPQQQPKPRREKAPAKSTSDALEVSDSAEGDDTNLVETPEGAPAKPLRKPRTRKPKAAPQGDGSDGGNDTAGAAE